MSEQSRARILSRLRAAPRGNAPARPDWQAPTYAPSERLARFTALMEAVHSEVHQVTETDWPEKLRVILTNKSVRNVLHAPATAAGRQLQQAWASGEAPALVAYDRPLEELKDVIVSQVDAGITNAAAGIADTGTLVLWPNADEPRLMSLLPPIHVALLREESVVDNLPGLMASGDWAGKMPTNLVLISGPSKTADIEQTLAYGVHGPKELVVLVIRRG